MNAKTGELVVHPAEEASEKFRRFLHVDLGIPACLVSDKSIRDNVMSAWRGMHGKRLNGHGGKEAAMGITNENGKEMGMEANDMSAMREALEEIVSEARCADKELEGEFGSMTDPWSYVASMADIARAALAAPPRNCDVGTADEQADRFKAFCYANRTPDNECSKGCPFNDTSAVCYCQARWAQTPYNEKEKTNDDTWRGEPA